jgi:hypothetical protein
VAIHLTSQWHGAVMASDTQTMSYGLSTCVATHPMVRPCERMDEQASDLC